MGQEYIDKKSWNFVTSYAPEVPSTKFEVTEYHEKLIEKSWRKEISKSVVTLY